MNPRAATLASIARAAWVACALDLAAGCVAPRPPEGQCVFSEDCRLPMMCVARTCRAPCASDRDCANAGRCRRVETLGTSVCFNPGEPWRCVRTSDCPGTEFCAHDGVCRPQCISHYDCQIRNPFALCLPEPGGTAGDGGMDAGARSCQLAGRDAGVDAAPMCPAGRQLCGGACVDLGTDSNHCGSCGQRCAAANATASCVAGACRASCNAGFGDCDGNAANGCETDLAGSVMHCGGCGRACTLAHATAMCRAGACSVAACDAGWGDCDRDPANGCEVQLTSLTNCGACAASCSFDNAAASCSSGTCVLGACAPGWGNCDGMAVNGCEAALGTATNCGACGVVCRAPAPYCGGGMPPTCRVTCGPGQTLCGTACVDLAADVTNCGACGAVCNPPHATGMCTAGACGIAACDPGWDDCNRSPGDGCEVDRSRDVSNCGGCGMRCALPNATASCTASVCTVARCSPGFGDCDTVPANGCEVGLGSDPANCGMCMTRCSFPNASGVCMASACRIGVCAPRWGNCDLIEFNGCETPTDTDISNCGVCRNACRYPQGFPACTAGMCSLAGCAAGFGDCNGTMADGCETNTDVSVMHCGACGNVCSAPANATPTCLTGTCDFVCDPGYMRVGGTCDPIPGCPSGLCDPGETPCNCPIDCPPTAGCGSLGRSCCPTAMDASLPMCTAGLACELLSCRCLSTGGDSGGSEPSMDVAIDDVPPDEPDEPSTDSDLFDAGSDAVD